VLEILASLRSAKLDALEDELRRLEAARVDALHVDVMDGRFVPERCFSAEFVQRLRSLTPLPIDVHLLTLEPENLATMYAEAGANRICFHLEAARDARALLRDLQDRGLRCGLVLLPSTALTQLEPFLDVVDVVNPLGVDPTEGLGFQESTYERIRWLRERREELELGYRIQADGGVWAKTRDGLVEAGADELVGGYPIFSADEYSAAVAALRDGA
jgi:ribulose-phosphate 3-epimerase